MRDAWQVRAHVEKQIDLIAKGRAEKDAVVAHTLHQFAQKFFFFVQNVARMDQLFEASFSPLASSGAAPSLDLLTVSGSASCGRNPQAAQARQALKS